MSESRIWQDVAKNVQEYRDQSLNRIPGGAIRLPEGTPQDVTGIPERLLSEYDLRITGQDTEELLVALSTRALTSTAVVSAFLRRAALAQALANCITEILPERALERAEYLDQYIERHGKPFGPLHGLPISVKEHIGMKGLTLNAVFVSKVRDVASEDATLLHILLGAGAIPYVRTTEPQTIMHLETSSNLYGMTLNPYNTNLTAGGSSGGEGALQALRGSVLGIGSDIGGIRSPAANNGIWGLKPSAMRLPTGGTSFTMMGNEQILGTFGPMSTSLSGIKAFMKAVIDRQPWALEPSLNPIPWRDWSRNFTPSSRLRVAVLWDDGVVKPHPPVMRALQETVRTLHQDESIEILEWTPWKHDYAWDLIAKLYFPDGAKAQMDLINASGEPLRPHSKFILQEQKDVRELSTLELWEITNQRNEYRAAYHKKWNETATGMSDIGLPTGMVDVILCPAGPGAAPPLDCARYWGYTSQWNLLDYSALVFPVSKVDLARDVADVDYRPRNEADAYNHTLYQPERYKNAPVSLQLVGRQYEEEKVVAIAEHLDKILRKNKVSEANR